MHDMVSHGGEPRPGTLSGFDNLVRLGRYRAQSDAESIAFAFLKDGEAVQHSLTYSDLDRRARAVAAWLQARDAHGERVILLYPSGLEFIVAFMGCLYAGALAVPVYAPQARDEHWARLDMLATDADAKFLLTTVDLHASVGKRIETAPFLSGLSLCASDALEDAACAAWSDPVVDADTVAFLQYTSGSTGAPKGVMVTHGNLLHNQMLMHTAFGTDRNSVFVSWLPLFHDMGLIGNILHTLYLGARCYVMAPVAFLQQPVRWLRAISDYRGTSSFAPNFAYDLCARRITQEQKAGLDLSCWTFALNGAEPVRADTLDRFAEAFAGCGFSARAMYPGYGLAEGTLFASGGLQSHGYKVERFDAKALESNRAAVSDAADAQPLVSSGRAWCESEILIVDPVALQPCEAGAIGEVWLRSPSVAVGYWNKPEATLETFCARVSGSEARYLRTGDLGFLRNGELFVNGRLKELIILRGRNLYPQDIEATVQGAWEGLRKGGGASFSVDIDGEERLIVVQEVERTFLRELDPERVEADVRQAIAEVHEAHLYDLVLIRPATLAKTSSGKIQRRKSQRDYIDGRLDGLYRSRAPQAYAEPSVGAMEDVPGGQGIESKLRREAARVLQIEPGQLKVDASLVGQGMDSLALVEFIHAIEQVCGAIYPLEKLLAGASLQRVIEETATASPSSMIDAASSVFDEADTYPLSANQQALWYLQKLQPNSHAYNVWLPIRLEAELDRSRLERAVALLLGRHRSLRCRFVETEHGPVQVVQAAAPSAFAVIDAAADERTLRDTIRASVIAPIDLERGLPFRVEYYAHARGAVLVLMAHHVCVDLTSMMQLLAELAALYSNPDASLPITRASYFQYVAAERRYLDQGAQADREYWRASLGHSLPVLDLPKRVARPKLQSFDGDCVEFPLPAELGRALTAYARTTVSTPFSVLLTAYALLLHRYTRQEDVIIGVPVLGRPGRAYAETVGYFVNTVAVMSCLKGDEDIAGHHDQIKRRLEQALAHSALPFAHVVDCVQPQRDSAIPPLTQTLFNLHKAHAHPELARLVQAQSTRALALCDWTVAPYRLPPRSSQLDLSLNLVEMPDGSYEGRLDYCTGLFERAFIERLAGSFVQLLQAMVENPRGMARRLPLLTESERQRVVEDWNDTDRDWGDFVSVDEIISRRASAEPDAIAVVYEGQSLTYGELESRSNAVAAALSSLGARAESVVGVSMRRSDRLVIALLGVMKAGAAYLPLDPSLPAARIAAMTAMAQPVLSLCDDDREGAVPDGAVGWSELLRLAQGLAPPMPTHAPAQAAYVIYTSGSTGQPKGVVNSHEGLANRLLWMQRRFGLSRGDRVMLKTAYTFDVSVWEFFWPLMAGATIVVARHEGHRDAGYIRELIRDERVNLLHFVPSMLKAFLDEPHLEALTSLRQLVCSGEELGVDVQAQCLRKLPQAALANLYGPTEAAIDVSCWNCRSEAGELRVPIGFPIDNLRLYVLDETLDVVPVGVAGELYIGGIGLARGYISRPDLTADRFVPAPLGGRPGERLYRTGDLACYREDGAIDFLGRLDHQVKLRGLRIELGEIDSHARDCDGIADALTVLDRRSNGDGYLLCYLVLTGNADRDAVIEDVRRRLVTALPAYMIPEKFMLLDAFPLNASGKVDRKRLPPPTEECAPVDSGAGSAPATRTEARLQDFLRELLNVDMVRVSDSFFDLGGHSLLATRLCSRIRGGFGIEINVVDVLMHPVVADMAALIDARATVEAADDAQFHKADDEDALSAAQRRLWFIEQLEGPSAAYSMPLVVRLTGPLTPDAVVATVRAVLGRHAELRCRYTAGVNGPVREVLSPESIEIELEDLTVVAAERREAELHRHLERAARHVFRLDQGPMCQAWLAVLSDDALVLTLLVHHIAADGVTLSMLMQQIGAELSGHAAAGGSEYGGYCGWQNAMQREGRWDAQLDYWRGRLEGMPALLELPTDLPRPPMASGEGGVVRRRMDAATTVAVERLAAGNQATEFMVFAACYQILLGRYACSDDVFIGTAVSTRNHAAHEGVAGLFVNTLVLRTALDRNQSFQSHLLTVRETCLGAYANADVPFDDVVGAISPARSLSHAPLVQAMLTVQPDVLKDCRWPAHVDAEWLPLHTGTAKFDINLLATRQGEGWLLELEYRSDLFLPESVAAMLSQFVRLLDSVVSAPQSALAALELQTPAEAAALLARTNRGHRRLDDGGCLHTRFAALLTRIDPQSIAVCCGTEQLSYAALDAQSNRIARYLRGLGVSPEHRIGLCMERSVDMVVALLAILKAGGAYVPLDPHYPAERLHYMAVDSGLRYVLGDRDHAGLFDGSDVIYLAMEDLPADVSIDALPSLGDERNAAYVIYTSGSTGRPKGVVVTHANVARLFAAADAEFAFGPDDVWSLFHSYAFDFSVWEIWGALLYGGRLVVVPYLISRSPEDFVDFVEREGVTVLNQTPTAFQQFIAAERLRATPLAHALRYVVFGGEKLNLQALATWFDRYPSAPQLVNMYGITETTVHVTFRALSAGDVAAHASPIGAGLVDLRLYVLDASMRPQAPGVPGELFVAGAGLARGYLGRPELTADRFLPDPFASAGGERMYRTGDLVRQGAGGEINYLGRIDQQVKIRGFRIELGEIEAACAECEGVAQAVVRVSARDELIGYLVPEHSESLHAATIQARLRGRLPDYMVPTQWVVIDAVPMTANGKVDHRRLPEPETRQAATAAPGALDQTEQLVLQSWSSLLERDIVDAGDNFFAVGGNSLLATRAITQAQRLFGARLGVRDLFDHPTAAAFAGCIRARLAGREVAAAPIPPAPPHQQHPASYGQERLWFLDSLNVGSTLYTMPGAFAIAGELDPVRFATALSAVVARHEALRTRFRLDQQPDRHQVVQIVDEAAPVDVHVHDLSALSELDRASATRRLIADNAAWVFDLGADRLLRCALAKLGEREWLLLLNVHHIVFDGVSLSILSRELDRAYTCGTQRWDAPTIQFKDYAHWLRGPGQEEMTHHLAHWIARLEGAPPVLELPGSRPRPPIQSYSGAVMHFDMDADTAERLHAACRAQECTPYVMLMACYALLLSRYSGQRDLIVGTPVANRGMEQTQSLIGFFANTLPLRLDIDPSATVGEFLHRVRGELVAGLAHQALPFERLVEVLQTDRALSHSPVFQVMFVMQDGRAESLVLPGATITEIAASQRAAKFDLTLAAKQVDCAFRISLEYATDLFDAEPIRRLGTHYLQLLAGMVDDSECRLDTLSLIAVGERPGLIADAPRSDAGAPATLHGRFAAQAARTPQATALIAGAERLSYIELLARVRQRTAELIALGVLPGDLVAVCLPRDADLVVSMLAIQCAGAAYVPLDPQYPTERLRGILEDAMPKAFIGDRAAHGQVAACLADAQVLLVDAPCDSVRFGPESLDPGMLKPALPDVGGDALAYVIYTSGSTGRPKGVGIAHRNAVALLDWAADIVDTDDLRGVLASTSVCFDLSVYEIFLPLARGGTVLLVRNVLDLAELSSRHAVTLINTVPSAIDALARIGAIPDGVRVINLAGEPLTRAMVQRLHALSPARVYNLYGPSEDTTYSTWALIARDCEAKPAIGRPVAGTQAYVLDETMNALPVGVPGELYLGGDGVAQGYLGRPDLTAEKFVPNPFGQPGARLYRTGDTVRVDEAGELEFIGRLDHQVKIRGFRIELGDIEHHLACDQRVGQCAVLVHERNDGERDLVACVAAKDGGSLDIARLRAGLESRLPQHMVPARFQAMDALPQTPNGKIDRKALAISVAVAYAANAEAAPVSSELRSDTEHALGAIWRDLLSLPRVGGDSHFFRSGGHSLLAVRLAPMIRERFGVELPTRKIFEYPMLSALAEYIDTQKWLTDALPATTDDDADTLVDEGVL